MIENDVIHVLVVDDEIDQLRRYIKAFSGSDDEGEQVRVGDIEFFIHYESHLQNAYEALTFSDYPVDVVVIDLIFENDANRNGVWLLQEIGTMSADLPVVMFTGFPDTTFAHQAGLLKADRFLEKAFYLNEGRPEDIGYFLNELFHVVYSKQKQPETHDREHLKLADAYADEGYDEGEQVYPATMAYYLYENDAIVKEVNKLLAEHEEISICDIGCGTGRIEELLAREIKHAKTRVNITAVDFSGRMLRRLRAKELSSYFKDFSVRRGSAELLNMMPNDSCDLVLMAFGVPSYTKYQLSLAEAARICRPGGTGLFSVYNESSTIYEAQNTRNWEEGERPIAAIANPATGKLNVGGTREFDCEVFTPEYFPRLIHRVGFTEESITTFPTLHATLPISTVAKFDDSRQTVEGFPYCELFSRQLYDMDLEFSQAIPGRGHYVVVVGKKQV